MYNVDTRAGIICQTSFLTFSNKLCCLIFSSSLCDPSTEFNKQQVKIIAVTVHVEVQQWSDERWTLQTTLEITTSQGGWKEGKMHIPYNKKVVGVRVHCTRTGESPKQHGEDQLRIKHNKLDWAGTNLKELPRAGGRADPGGGGGGGGSVEPHKLKKIETL